MSGLFRRKSSRRSEGSEGSEPQPGAADAPAQTPAEPGGHESLLRDPAAPAEDTTRVIEPETPPPAPVYAQPQPTGGAFTPPPVYAAPQAYAPEAVVPVADLPAGLDPDELAAAPHTSARRSKLRRRVTFLRAAREVLLRDLGGFMYELHRTAHDHEAEAHRRLREIKLDRLTRVDAELHELEVLLDDVRRQVLIREPGVGGECPQCGELYGSASHFCSQCGLPLTDAARRELARVEPVVAAPQPVSDQPTEEFSPLDPDHPAAAGADFQWPSQNPSWTSTPTGMTGNEDPTRVDQPAAFTGPAAGESAAASGEMSSAAGGGVPTSAAGESAATGADRGGDSATVGETAAAADDDAATAGETAAAREGVAPAETAGEARAAGDDAAASGETAGSGDDVSAAARGEAAGDAAGDDATASGETAGSGDDVSAAARGEAAGEASAAGDDAAASGETAGSGDDVSAAASGETAGSGDDVSAAAPGEAAGDASAAGGGDATESGEAAGAVGEGGAPSGEGEESRDEGPVRNGSVFSPVERQQ